MIDTSDRCSERLQENLIAIMEQGQKLVSQLDGATYSQAVPDAGISSIGDHYRHQLDYIAAFGRGVAEGRIDYDDRRRDEEIATNPETAHRETSRLISVIGELGSVRLSEELVVVQRTADDGAQRPPMESSIDRELAFLVSHCMHHYAIIAMAVRLLGESPPEGLGVMPSTTAYERK